MLAPNQCTVTVATDLAHLGEFALALPTWRKFYPEFWQRPWLVFCDSCEGPGWWRRQFSTFTDTATMRFISVPPAPNATQRHRMLSAFVYGVAEHCKTPWYLKADSDCAIMSRNEGNEPPEWFCQENGYVFVTHPWHYTKPPELHFALVEWAKTVPEFAGCPEAPAQYGEGWIRVRHKRIISFALYGRTSFVQRLAQIASGPLMPTASQDGFIWYCAARLGQPYLRVHMDQFGWSHNGRRLAKRCKEAMEK